MRRPRLDLGSGLLAAAIALSLGGVGLYAARPKPGGNGEPLQDAALRSVESRLVQVESVESRTEVAGVLEPRRSVKISSETRGPVLELGAEALDRVEAGQVLVRIDPVLAEVAVERAEAALARRESELALARSELERRRTLAQEGVASAAALEDAETSEQVAEAALRESRAELARARDDLANKTISTPFSGVLRSFDLEVGEYVSAGQLLGELMDLEASRVAVGLSDRDVVTLQAGQQVQGRVEAWPGEVFAGEVLRIGAAADRATKKFPVEVEFPNPDGRLRPGMVVRVAIGLGEPVPRTLIPREATVDEFGLRFVYVLSPEPGATTATLRRRRVEVRPVPFRPAVFELVSGLSEGERIAMGAVRQLREGERVRLRSVLSATGGAP